MKNSIAETGNLLLVDDHTASLQVLSKLLKEAGFKVRVARNGEQAIETVKYELPDLILLDVMMPGMNGYQVCQVLKSDPSTQDIPVIFMTALDESVDKVKGLNMGAVDYITKPFQQQEVLARIKIHIKIYLLKKKLEKQNQRLQQEMQSRKTAENANEAKSKFLAQMSHELRTPLNIILGFSQVMNRDPSLTEEQQENLEMITSSGEHLLELIERILSMSKIDAGKMDLHLNSFDLYYLLDSLEEMFQVPAASKGLQLVFDRADDVPQYLETDEAKLRQVLINLLDNGIKFTEVGKVTLRVQVKGKMLTYTGSRKMAIAFEVEDTGPGIEADKIEELFQPFVQKVQEFQSGAGLGLAISREYVRLMDGDLTVSNAIKNRGSIFYFYIQAHLASESQIERQQLGRAIGMVREQAEYRILVVDDKWENRQLLVKLFSSVGLEVRSAENGREAVDMWSEFAPHLIWMDMQMPVMNGYEATKEIKSQLKGQATVIIAMTSQNFSDDRASILEAGCDDFVNKPFQEAVLFEKMAEHLGITYVYEENVPTRKSQLPAAPEVTAEALGEMALEWVEQLYQAALELDDELIYQLMEQIPQSNASLVKGLSDLVEHFRFDKLMDLAEQAMASDRDREAGSAGEENRLDKEKDL